MMITFEDKKSKYVLKLCGKELCFEKDSSYLAVGNAETNFSMSRGSFKYKKKIKNTFELYFSDVKETSDGVYAELADKASNIHAKVHITAQGDVVKIHPEISGGSFDFMKITLPAEKSEHIYGCGETFTRFDLRGENVRIWVAEHQNANRIAKKLIKTKLLGRNEKRKGKFSSYESYYAQPTFVSSEKYFVHVDSSSYMEFDFRNENNHCLNINDIADVYFGGGEDFIALTQNLTALLGRPAALPDWVHDGMILGIQGGTDKVQEKLDKLLALDAKVCGVWCQDWCGARITGFGKQVMWNWAWDKDWYKDLDKKIAEWKSRGIHFLGYINTFMAIEKELYKYAAEKGYCVKDKDGNDYLVKITTFPAAMIDLTNPEGYEWIKGIIKTNMIALGLDGWMADFGEYLPTDCVLFSGEDPKMIHNRWAALWAKVNREAIEETGNLGKVFFFTRAGFTQTVKYSTMMWNGDQHVDFSIDDGLPSVIPASLSLSVSGFGLCHSDVGGYTTFMNMTRDNELYMRWCEMNVFSPLLRSHEGNQPDRNVQFDSDDILLKFTAEMSRLHYEIKPYIKECENQAVNEGVPAIRPLFWHYNSERDFTESYEYLLGRDVLVAPVIERKAEKREVYLPNDNWIHIFSGKEYSGGIYTVDSPLGRPPLFIRKESPFKDVFTF